MSNHALESILEVEGRDRLEELLEWRYDHRETAIGGLVFRVSNLTPRLIEAQKESLREILESGRLSELTADEVHLAAWQADHD